MKKRNGAKAQKSLNQVLFCCKTTRRLDLIIAGRFKIRSWRIVCVNSLEFDDGTMSGGEAKSEKKLAQTCNFCCCKPKRYQWQLFVAIHFGSIGGVPMFTLFGWTMLHCHCNSAATIS